MTTSNRPPAGSRPSVLAEIVTCYPDASLDFIRSSFYLPVDVLTDSRYKVEKIEVVLGASFRAFADHPSASKCRVIAEGATPAMLQHAKHVGVSCRTVLATNEKIMIAKLWYGNSQAAS